MIKGWKLLYMMSIVLLISGCSFSVAQSMESENKITEVILKEYTIAPGEIRLTGTQTPVKLTVKNKGMSTHNFVIEELGVDSGIIRPGESVTLNVEVKDDATLQAKCTLPGHAEAGMVAEVIVSQ